jgi:signal transduction histidine kinase
LDIAQLTEYPEEFTFRSCAMATLQEREIISLIALGSTGILALIIGIAVFLITYQRRMLKAQVREQQREKEYQQRMIQMQLESQEAERKRIAADLHDSVGSLLWGAKLAAVYLDRSGENDIHRTSLHNELMDILDQSILTVKQISWELTPEACLVLKKVYTIWLRILLQVYSFKLILNTVYIF